MEIYETSRTYGTHIDDKYIDHSEICALVGYYAAYNNKFLTDVSGKLSVPYSRVKKSFLEL